MAHRHPFVCADHRRNQEVWHRPIETAPVGATRCAVLFAAEAAVEERDWGARGWDFAREAAERGRTMTDGNTGARYVWGIPSLTIDDTPDDRRLLFAVRLSLFRIARRFAYTRRGRVLGSALAFLLSLTGVAVVLAVSGSLGWALVAGGTGPAFILVVWRHRGIRVFGASAGPPDAGDREPRRPVQPSGAGTVRPPPFWFDNPDEDGRPRARRATLRLDAERPESPVRCGGDRSVM
jgi:hypothetical protein